MASGVLLAWSLGPFGRQLVVGDGDSGGYWLLDVGCGLAGGIRAWRLTVPVGPFVLPFGLHQELDLKSRYGKHISMINAVHIVGDVVRT